VLQLEQAGDDEDLAVHAVAGPDDVDHVGLAHPAERDDDVADLVVEEHLHEVLRAAEDPQLRRGVLALGVDVQEPDRLEAVLRVLRERAGEVGADLAGAEDERAVGDAAGAAGPADQRVGEAAEREGDRADRERGEGEPPVDVLAPQAVAERGLQQHREREGGEKAADQRGEVVQERERQPGPVEAGGRVEAQEQHREDHHDRPEAAGGEHADEGGEDVEAEEQRADAGPDVPALPGADRRVVVRRRRDRALGCEQALAVVRDRCVLRVTGHAVGGGEPLGGDVAARAVGDRGGDDEGRGDAVTQVQDGADAPW
jgi:hypothetical protein